MVRFEYSTALYLLLLIPLLLLILIYLFKQKKQILARFANPDILPKITPHISLNRQYWKSGLILCALVFFIISLARPQYGTRVELIKRKGIDLVIAFDISKSMLAEDIAPSRLTRAKMEIEMIINQLKGDRIALIIFAGIPFIQCPLTLDYAAAKMMLDIINPELIPVPGTNLPEAIKMAEKAFDEEDRKSRIILLITDGENHEGDIEEVANDAAKKGIKIFTVGIGALEGTPIPEYDENGYRSGHKKDRHGNLITTRLDETTLEKIALLTNGKYFHASPDNSEIHKILNEINALEKSEIDSRKFSQYEERFYYPLAIGFFLLFLESLIPDRKKRKKLWKGRFEI